MTWFPDCNVKTNYFQSPAYWDTPHEAPFCCHETTSENIFVALLHCGSHRSWMHLAKSLVSSSILPELQDKVFFCCYLQKCVQSYKTVSLRVLRTLRQGMHSVTLRLHFLLLQVYTVWIYSRQERLGHPQWGFPLTWRWELNILREILSLHGLVDILHFKDSGGINISGDIPIGCRYSWCSAQPYCRQMLRSSYSVKKAK